MLKKHLLRCKYRTELKKFLNLIRRRCFRRKEAHGIGGSSTKKNAVDLNWTAQTRFCKFHRWSFKIYPFLQCESGANERSYTRPYDNKRLWSVTKRDVVGSEKCSVVRCTIVPFVQRIRRRFIAETSIKTVN